MGNNLVGVDACRGGWVAATGNGSVLSLSLIDQIKDVPERADTVVLIDMPIGLPAAARTLEPWLRARLGARRSSVFNVPVRDAVYAGDYAAASARNAAATGKRLSRQTWNICHRIREVDELLQQRAELRVRFIECHPEMAFCDGDHGPCTHPKRTVAGQAERFVRLESRFPAIRQTVEGFLSQYPRRLVDITDCLDAASLYALGIAGFDCHEDEGYDPVLGLHPRLAIPTGSG